MKYCKPSQTGLNSTTQAVARRIGRLLDALDSELTCHVLTGGTVHHASETKLGDPSNGVVDDIKAFRWLIVERLEADGWSMSYDDGGNKTKVRAPGHKQPFPRH